MILCHKIVKNNLKPNMFGAIELLCQGNAASSMVLPDIQNIVEKKWERAGQTHFMKDIYSHLFTLGAITILSVFPNATLSLHPQTQAQTIVTIVYPLVAFDMLWKLTGEVPQILKHGLMYWGAGGQYATYRSSVAFRKRSITVAFISFFILFAIKIKISTIPLPFWEKYNDAKFSVTWEPTAASAPPDITPLFVAANFFLAISTLTMWLGSFYFCMGLDSAAPFVLTIFRCI